MNFSFVIITTDGQDDSLAQAVFSIHKQEIPEYEIIIVGRTNHIVGSHTIHITFDESIKPGWITRKKNLGWQAAKYENIVFMHDYVKLDTGWYEGYTKFGNNFDACVNKLIHKSGARGVDWVLPPYNMIPEFKARMERYGAIPYHNQEVILCYSLTNFGKYVYAPGNFWVARRSLMEEFPLNEDLVWGQEEDVEWSKRVQTKYGFSLNVNSSCYYTKDKPVGHYYCRESLTEKLRNIPL
jgi:hypothetical protein